MVPSSCGDVEFVLLITPNIKFCLRCSVANLSNSDQNEDRAENGEDQTHNLTAVHSAAGHLSFDETIKANTRV